MDSPRAFVRAVCHPQPDPERPACCRLAVELHLVRPRTGEKVRRLSEVVELTTRAAQEQELFPPGDWEFIRDTLKTIKAPVNARELGIESEYIIKALMEAHNIRKERYTILGDRGLTEAAATKLARKTGVIE